MAKVRKRGWYRRGKNAYLDKRVLGRRLPVENLGPVSDRDADLIVAKRVADFLHQRHFPELNRSSLTVGDLLSTYDDESLSKLASVKTAKYHVERLNAELGDELAEAVNWPRLLDYGSKRITEGGVVTRTVEAELDILAGAYNWSRRYHELTCSPFPPKWKEELKAKYPQDGEEPYILDGGEEKGNEWQRIYNNAGANVRLALLLAYETGMRAKEVVTCRTAWLRNGAIHLPRGVATKNRKGRVIQLSADLYNDLIARAGKEYVFEQEDGRPYTYSWLRSGLRRAATKGEVTLPRWSGCHTLRRTRATIDAGKGGDIEAAMDKLGHSDYKTFRKYSQVTEYRRKKAANA